MLGSMAEPSLLCVNCAAAPPPHRRTWSRCTVCIERNLPSTYYCGEECMNAHWPKHKEYHTVQKERMKQMREAGRPERTRSASETAARDAEATGDELDKRFAAAVALNAEGDYHAAAKAWRKMIKEQPTLPEPYFNLATVLDQSDRDVEAAPMYLKAMELSEEGTERWAQAAASAFDLLKTSECDEVPKPEWWNDEALKALSARVVALAPDESSACIMRADVLTAGSTWQAGGGSWDVGQRTAAEIKEAATWFRRAARMCRFPATDQLYEGMAHDCDESADPLLAEEKAEAEKTRAAAEAEAAKARAAAEAEEAEAMKVAEAKASAAAEELLAEEEKEKQQATSTKAGKAKQSQGRKGKGKR